MATVEITSHIDDMFTHYRMSPGIFEYMGKEMHIATSTKSNSSDMVYVSFAVYYHELPNMPGAWFENQDLVTEAVQKWAELVQLQHNYKIMQRDLLPPF